MATSLDRAAYMAAAEAVVDAVLADKEGIYSYLHKLSDDLANGIASPT